MKPLGYSVLNDVNSRRRRLAASVALAPLFAACGGGGGSRDPATPAAATRTWKMGFYPTPSRPTVDSVLTGIDRLSTRAELVHIHEELPWTDLLMGVSADAILDRDKAQLVNYIRSKGLRLSFMADLTDGLSRGEEAPQLRKLGRSITEPAVQQVYRDYVSAFVRKLQPDFVGLAAETNLTRAAAPAPVYAAMVQAANAAAQDLRALSASPPLMISVQVETAWGVLGGSGQFQGIARDFTDFPFVQQLGLSSYPYLGYARPEDVPGDYYQRLLTGRTMPALVVEGGWTSASVGSVVSSPDVQRRYITRHAALLDSISARTAIQTLFSDIDISQFPQPLPSNLPLFTHLGLIGIDGAAKPALGAWDELFMRKQA